MQLQQQGAQHRLTEAHRGISDTRTAQQDGVLSHLHHHCCVIHLLIINPPITVSKSRSVSFKENTLLLPMVLFSTHRTSFPGELQFSGTPSTVFKSHEPSTKTCTSVTERRVAPRQELQRHNEQPKGGRRRCQEKVLPPVSFSCTLRFDLIIPNALSLLRNQILHQNRF